MKSLLQLALLISTLAAIAAPSELSAQAHLIDNGSTTIDTDAGLEWLDVTETQGRSWNQITLGLGGYLADGYHLADRFELCGLLSSLGDSLPNCTALQSGFNADAVSSSTVATFNALLGTTSLVRGFIQGPSFAGGEIGVVSILEGGSGDRVLTRFISDDFDSSSPFIGLFLVRPWVPTPVCTYGMCDATVCDTSGSRPATNQPCTGVPSVPCNAPSCPACTYDACSATVCSTMGTQTANNQPCIGATELACSAPTCPACQYGSTCSAACGGGTQPATNEPCTGPLTQTCNVHTCPAGDFNRDDVVDESDRDLFADSFGSSGGDGHFLPEADMDDDQQVTLVDYQLWIAAYREFLAEQIGSVSLPASGTPVPTLGGVALVILGAALGLLALQRSRSQRHD